MEEKKKKELPARTYSRLKNFWLKIKRTNETGQGDKKKKKKKKRKK